MRTYIHVERDQLSTVRADVKWIPGYDGGQSVWYTVSYRKLDDRQFTKTEGINADCNCYTIKEGLEADKHYRFFVQAQNNDGPSNSSNIIERKTEGKLDVEERHSLVTRVNASSSLVFIMRMEFFKPSCVQILFQNHPQVIMK